VRVNLKLTPIGLTYFPNISNIASELVFNNNCRNSRALIGLFSLSISGQTHEFIVHAMRRRTRADNLIICYREKQIGVSISCVYHVIDNEFRHNIVKVVCGSTRVSPRGPQLL